MNQVQCVEDLGCDDNAVAKREENKKMLSAFLLALACALYVINNYDEVVQWTKKEKE